MLNARHFGFSVLLVFCVSALLFAVSVPAAVSTAQLGGEGSELLPTPFLENKSSISCPDKSAQEFLNSYGMLKNGSEFTLKVILTPTNYSKEIGKTELYLHSYFIDRGIEPSIWVNGENIGYRNPFEMDPETDKKVEVILSARAPEVSVRTPITLLKIVQETSGGEYLVVDIEREVSSPLIERVLAKIEEAKAEIEEAKKLLSNETIEEASTYLETAELHLQRAESEYLAGRPEKALEEARNATENAMLACKKVRYAESFAGTLKLVALAVVVVVVVVAVLLLLLKRQRERGKLG